MTTQTADKMLVLGVDGLDPRFAKYCLNKGLMPNLQKLIDNGSCREDLVMLGGMPTVTPPMWTTLATGAYAGTHGITAFYNQDPENMARRIYALDSRMCKAEQLWNVFAEAGKKTLVWHWPGSSWPPTSDNPNLAVVDGTQPTAVNMGVALIDWEKICIADAKNETVKFKPHTSTGNDGAGCIITNLDGVVQEDNTEKGEHTSSIKSILGNSGSTAMVLTEEDTEIVTLGQIKLDEIDSPICAPRNWQNAPDGAKELTYMTSEGLIRRPCLIVPNDEGIYDKLYIYKSKKDSEPFAILTNNNEFVTIWDEILVKEEKKEAYRSMKILDMAPDGSYIKFWMSMAFDAHNDSIWHPKSLMQEIYNNVGPVANISLSTGKNLEYAWKLILQGYDRYNAWQADCLNYFMDNDKFEIIFSHLHNVDSIGHQIWHFANERLDERWKTDHKEYEKLLERTYEQTDEYIGRFIPYLEKGWTIILTSDHGLISEENHPPGLGEGGTNATVMKDLGYTVLKKDANGNDIKEVDYTKTKAIANRGCYINLNMKGRHSYGIVEPEDKYELERQIITDLYNYRDPHTGQRVVSLALRNKDAAVLGLSGPECGDIVYFMDEGYNIIHMDSLSTFEGHFNTSVSPIFVAAGKGIKAGFKTDRTIRQVDVAPTMAVLGGVRMPKECEGAPIYQILAD